MILICDNLLATLNTPIRANYIDGYQYLCYNILLSPLAVWLYNWHGDRKHLGMINCRVKSCKQMVTYKNHWHVLPFHPSPQTTFLRLAPLLVYSGNWNFWPSLIYIFLIVCFYQRNKPWLQTRLIWRPFCSDKCMLVKHACFSATFMNGSLITTRR